MKSDEPSSKTSQKAFGFLAGVAATVASNEYLSPKLLASINIPYAIGQTKDGLFSPDGGCEGKMLDVGNYCDVVLIIFVYFMHIKLFETVCCQLFVALEGALCPMSILIH